MTFNAEDLLFIPLGGAEQFGANLNVYGYKGKWLAIDMGMGFADEYYPGVDILLPDPSFLEGVKKNIAGLIITHAHEDHIGGVSYLWPRLKCPIFCTEFTAAVLEKKLAENPECKGARVRIVKRHDPVSIGPFTATFIPVTHSIPESSSVLLETEAGKVMHSGDWNLDPTPVIGKPIDAKVFKDIGDQGVLAYIGDSTNAGVDGYSGSERDVEKGLIEVFKECDQRIVVTIFASNIGRIRSICKAAEANDRHVAILGRSLHRMIGAARDCGYLNDIQDFVDEEDISVIPRDKIVVIATGSQGEPRAQIARVARGDQKNLKLQQGDTVIFSARPIPGNEKEIIFVQNRLAGQQVSVINPRDTKHCIHVSGHPAREEIKKMYDWLRPQVVIPVHGEKVMIEDQAELAAKHQIKSIAPNNGSVIKLAPGTPEIIDHVDTGLLAVEPGRIIDASHVAISDRRKLQFSGSVHATVVIDNHANLLARPELSLVGLIDEEDEFDREFVEDLKDEIESTLSAIKRGKIRDINDISEKIRINLRRDIFEVLKIKTKVTVHVVRV